MADDVMFGAWDQVTVCFFATAVSSRVFLACKPGKDHEERWKKAA